MDNSFNPKWQRLYMLSMLKIETLQSIMQDEWSTNPRGAVNTRGNDQNTGGSDAQNITTKDDRGIAGSSAGGVSPLEG